jgi:hypothetical protein
MSDGAAAIIAAVAALAGVFLGNIFASKTSRRQRYNETVAQRRVEWIRMMSEHVGTMIAEVEAARIVRDMKNGIGKHKLLVECVEKYYKSKNLLLSQVNMSENEIQQFSILVSGLDGQLEKYDPVQFAALREQLLEVVRRIEKIEWVKTKNEAIGKE